MSVIKAIRIQYKKNRPFIGNDEDFEKFIKTENHAYVFEILNPIIEGGRPIDGEISDKVLRIDLFRGTVDSEDKGKDFISGILHTLKHYRMEDVKALT